MSNNKKAHATSIIVGIRHKKGIRQKIKETQPIYYYLYPFLNVEIGDYVLLEYQRKTEFYRKSFFGVGKVVFIEKGDIAELIEKYKPTAYVLYRFPQTLDFEKRCDTIKNAKQSLMKRYKIISSNDAKMRQLLKKQVMRNDQNKKINNKC